MTLEDIEDENQEKEKEDSAQPLEESECVWEMVGWVNAVFVSLEPSAAGAAVVPTHDSAPSSGLLDELLGRLPTVMNRKFVDEVNPLSQKLARILNHLYLVETWENTEFVDL